MSRRDGRKVTRRDRARLIALVVVPVASVAIALAFATRSGDRAKRAAHVKTVPGSKQASRKPSATSAPVASTLPSTSSSSSTTTVAPAVPTKFGALNGHIIVVDAGHNGGNYQHGNDIARPIFIGTQNRNCDTTGTSTYDGYTEAAYNLDVALRLRDVLSAAGAKVVMVRIMNDGWGPCIDERAYIGNRAGAEAGISIHADGGPDGGRGFHVNTPANIPGYTDDIYTNSRTLGIDLRDAYLATGMPTATYLGSNGMLERRDFGGLNLSNVPKVLFETGNMRNSTDAALLKDPNFRQRVAETLAVGFAQYFAGR